MSLVFSGCLDTLYVLGGDLKTYSRSMFHARDPHRVAAKFIAEHDGVAAIITRVGGDAPHTWGVTASCKWLPCDGGYITGTIFYFPGATHGLRLVDGVFIPMQKKKDRLGRDRWVYGSWPDALARPSTIPFASDELWIPNLR